MFPDQNEVKLLQSILTRLEQFHLAKYEGVAADAVYKSLENYLYLDFTGQTYFLSLPAMTRSATENLENRFAV